MSHKAMLEASMLIHRDSANYLLGLARNEFIDVSISSFLLDIAAKEPESLVHSMSPILGISQTEIHIPSIRLLANELIEKAHTYQHPLEWENSVWYDGTNRLFYEVLKENMRNDIATRVIFDEWCFLNQNSWIFAKTRQAFDVMIEAGGKAFQVSRNYFDRMVRRTLKKDEDDILTVGNKIRAITKWVAVGGPSFLSLTEPVSGAIFSSVSGVFLLADP